MKTLLFAVVAFFVSVFAFGCDDGFDAPVDSSEVFPEYTGTPNPEEPGYPTQEEVEPPVYGNGQGSGDNGYPTAAPDFSLKFFSEPNRIVVDVVCDEINDTCLVLSFRNEGGNDVDYGYSIFDKEGTRLRDVTLIPFAEDAPTFLITRTDGGFFFDVLYTEIETGNEMQAFHYLDYLGNETFTYSNTIYQLANGRLTYVDAIQSTDSDFTEETIAHVDSSLDGCGHESLLLSGFAPFYIEWIEVTDQTSQDAVFFGGATRLDDGSLALGYTIMPRVGCTFVGGRTFGVMVRKPNGDKTFTTIETTSDVSARGYIQKILPVLDSGFIVLWHSYSMLSPSTTMYKNQTRINKNGNIVKDVRVVHGVAGLSWPFVASRDEDVFATSEIGLGDTEEDQDTIFLIDSSVSCDLGSYSSSDIFPVASIPHLSAGNSDVRAIIGGYVVFWNDLDSDTSTIAFLYRN